MYLPELSSFPSFSLENLLQTCFGSKSDNVRQVCILIDLPDLSLMKDNRFLEDKIKFPVQAKAFEHFYQPLLQGECESLGFENIDLFAFKTTGGSNLDPEDSATDSLGNALSLEQDNCAKYDLILAITDYSLTAPLTALAKQYGFRGATLHGVNDIILNSGLSVDYRAISEQAETFRLVLDEADSFDLEFELLDSSYQLRIDCDRQTAQKSHGLCPVGKPDVANLPAGEVYFVPSGASGSFPFQFSDGTLAEMQVSEGAIRNAVFIKGDPSLVDARNQQLKDDPATGIIGELGFGTQILPFSGKDIQDEKIFGTCHVATGRSDHLGGNLTPDLFNSRLNASHDDILFAPPKTPEISVSKVVLNKNGNSEVIFEGYEPTPYLLDKVSSHYPVEKFSSLHA